MTTAVDRGSLAKIRDDVDFYAHQVDGIRDLARRRNFILADDMGLGKSLQSLTVAAIDFERGWASRILIVAPATLKANWQEEINERTTFTCEVLKGTPKQRHRLLDQWAAGESRDVLIVGYEQVKSHLDELNALRFDIVICDEAHLIKNPKSARTKAVQKLGARRFFLLTGSPLMNRADELWSLLHRVAPDQFPKYWPFVHRYCVFGGFQGKQIVGVKNEGELKSKLDDFMLRRLKSDVLDLPDKQIIPVWVDLLPEQRRLYNHTLGKIFEESAPEDLHDVDNALTRFLRLKQIAATTYTVDPPSDHSAKLDLLEEYAWEFANNGEHLVVFTQFIGVQQMAAHRLTKNGHRVLMLNADVPPEDRPAKVRRWGDSTEPSVLVVSLHVGGVGLNMTQASKCIFLDKLYVPALNDQAVDRLHRIGADKSKPVQAFEILARDTIESRIETILKQKKKLFGSLVNPSDFKRALVAALYADKETA